MYNGLIGPNLWDLLKEKVCLVFDLLVDDLLISLNEATESIQKVDFINFIMLIVSVDKAIIKY